MTKIGGEWERSVREWEQRRTVALKAVGEIGLEKLGGLLGAGWEADVGLQIIEETVGEERDERRPLKSLAQGRGTNGTVEMEVGKNVARQVGAEIIDLSGE